MNRDEVIQGLWDIDAVTVGDRELYVTNMSVGRLNTLIREATKLLEPRVLTLEEVMTYDGALFVEHRASKDSKSKCAVLSATWLFNRKEAKLYDGITLINNHGGTMTFAESSYNATTRCWTARPSDEQRKAAAWAQGQ